MKIISVAIIGLFTLNINSMSIKTEAPLLGTHWKLVALSNAKSTLEETSGDAYLILKNDSTVTGNGGCNSFNGKYGLEKNNEISFGEIVRTNVACPAIDAERKFINSLARTDNYYIKGDTLSLNREQVSLAKFVAVHAQ